MHETSLHALGSNPLSGGTTLLLLEEDRIAVFRLNRTRMMESKL